MEYKNAEFLWDKLISSGDKVLIYGTGNGADKIVDLCNEYGIKISAIFSSDYMTTKSRTFRGFPVMTASAALNEFKTEPVLLSFAVMQSEVMEELENLSKTRRLYAPDVPVFGGGIITKENLCEREKDIEKLKNLLADEQSVKCLDNILAFKISGKIDYIREIETDRSQDLLSLFKMPDDAVYCDLGAYRGDTLEEYISLFGTPERALLFEPARVNFQKLSEYCADKPFAEIFNTAVYSFDGELDFSSKSGRGAHIGGNHKVSCVSLDSILRGGKADYIKFDVESAEEEALEGAKNTISKYAPMMSVSVYHKTWDFLDIPLKIAEQYPFYKLYLRHSPYIPAWDTYLYTIKKENQK